MEDLGFGVYLIGFIWFMAWVVGAMEKRRKMKQKKYNAVRFTVFWWD